jgi:2-amino-4-hydroxy-6-hydroxymethyldihydropteridine diphosphokinase
MAALGDLGIKTISVSRLYRTPCFPAGTGPDFVNAAASVVCDFPPTELLTLLHLVEARLGRERNQRWSARTIDIDLLAVGDLVLPDAETYRHWHDLPPELQSEIAPDQLILPHPRMDQRAFVLIPLEDVAPDWLHPVVGLTVAEMVRMLPEIDRAEVKPL